MKNTKLHAIFFFFCSNWVTESTIMLTGSRMSHRLRECNHQNLGFGIGLGFGFSCTQTIKLSPSVALFEKRLDSFSSSSIDFGHPLVGCIQPKSPLSQSPILSDCLRFSPLPYYILSTFLQLNWNCHLYVCRGNCWWSVAKSFEIYCLFFTLLYGF